MGIEHKHAYRFVYLKSDKWQNTRLEALVKAAGKCAICGEESNSNDAHHVVYPESFWDTTTEHLVILCRPCHKIAHAFVSNTKKDEEQKWSEWNSMIGHIKEWHLDKQAWMKDPDAVVFKTPKDLRDAYEKALNRLKELDPKPHKTPKANVPMIGNVLAKYDVPIGDQQMCLIISGQDMDASVFDRASDTILAFKSVYVPPSKKSDPDKN